VAITFLGEYYAGRGVVIRVTNTDPLLVLVSVIEVSDAIEISIPFPVHDVRLISQCQGKVLSGRLGISSRLQRSTMLTVSAAGRHHVLRVTGPIGSTLTWQLVWRLFFLFAVLTRTNAWGSESYWSAPHRVRGRVSEFLIATT
jgi:hypothetical protein